MTQKHEFQDGLFLVTTNAKGRVPWLTWPGVPEIIIDNLRMTKNLYGARLYAFCVLPNHMHMIVNPGPLGISKFMQAFKRNTTKDAHTILHQRRFANRRYCENDIAWQHSFHIRFLSDPRSIEHAIRYVCNNAMHHRLVESPDDWPWTSLNYPDLIDSLEW